jgi:predicted RNase H-like HicB family nuclease
MNADYAELAERYLILIEGGPPSNYSAWSPDVLGCVATGETVEECVASMREALAFHIEFLAEEGEPIPEPSVSGAYLSAEPREAKL